MTKKDFTTAFDRKPAQVEDFTDLVFDIALPDAPSVDEKALVPKGDGVYVYKRFTMTPVGMIAPDDMTPAELAEVGDVIRGLESSISWNVGDWALYAHKVLKKPYAQIAAEFGYDRDSLMSYVSVCEKIPTLIRNQGVHFSHHRRVTKLCPDLQGRWLLHVQVHDLTLAEMKAEMELLKGLAEHQQIAWLDFALSKTKRLSTFDELKPPAPPEKPAPAVGTKPFFSEGYALYYQASKGDKGALEKLRAFLWELAQEVDRLERGE